MRSPFSRPVSIRLRARIGALCATVLAAAVPCRVNAIEAGAETAAPVFRAIPLKELPPGAGLVAGERLSAFWEAGDSLRPMVQIRRPGAHWRLLRKPDPTAYGRLRADWRLPFDLSGPMEMRFCEPAFGKPLDSLRVIFVGKAGAPGMGPVLETTLEAAENDYAAGSDFIPYRTAGELERAQLRLATADGGAQCLPKVPALRAAAKVDASPFTGGLPILAARVKYHFRRPGQTALTAAEFRAVGFPDSVLTSAKVLFMLDDTYAFSNLADLVVRVEVRIGQDSLLVRRNSQRQYTFASEGSQVVFLKAFTTKGVAWEQATVVVVPPPEPQAAEEMAGRN